MSTHRFHLLSQVLVLALASVVGMPAHAWQYLTECSPAKPLRWNSSPIAYAEMQYLLDTDITFSIATLRSGLSASYWGYQREPHIPQNLYVDASTHAGYGSRTVYSTGAWWNGADSNREYWFDATPEYTAEIHPTTVGHAGFNWTCLSTIARINSADVALRADAHVRPQDNTQAHCLAHPNDYSVESTALHEVGHAYGLAHNDATLTVMHTGGTGARCDLSNSYHLLPWPDEVRGLAAAYGNVPGNARNVGGSAFYRPNNSPVTRDVITVSNPSNSHVFTFSYMSFYNSVDEWDFALYWVRNNTSPIGGTTYHIGTGSAAVSLSLHKVQVTVTSVLPLSGAAPGGFTYRLWVRVDPNGSLTETDEIDNWFPMAITYFKP